MTLAIVCCGLHHPQSMYHQICIIQNVDLDQHSGAGFYPWLPGLISNFCRFWEGDSYRICVWLGHIVDYSQVLWFFSVKQYFYPDIALNVEIWSQPGKIVYVTALFLYLAGFRFTAFCSLLRLIPTQDSVLVWYLWWMFQYVQHELL